MSLTEDVLIDSQEFFFNSILRQ